MEYADAHAARGHRVALWHQPGDLVNPQGLGSTLHATATTYLWYTTHYQAKPNSGRRYLQS